MGTVLRQVVVWPFTGPYSESWADGEAPPDHPAHDAFLRIMRRVSEAYAPHLADQRVPNRTSEVRLSVCGIGVDDTVTLSVVPDPKPDPSSFELVDLILPSTFAEATGTAQADTGLAVIAAAVASLAPSRGWSTAALDQAERNTRRRDSVQVCLAVEGVAWTPVQSTVDLHSPRRRVRLGRTRNRDQRRPADRDQRQTAHLGEPAGGDA